MKRTPCLWTITLVLAWAVLPAYGIGNMLRFDFEPADGSTEAGFIHVDENTVYTAGLGYGIYDPNEVTTSKWSRSRSNGIGMYTDFVCMGDERHFRVDVPNGDYYVTVIAGDPGYYQRVRFAVEGVVYGWTVAGGVSPTDAPLYIRQHTPWTEDMEQIDIPASAWREAGGGKVRVLGYNTGSYVDEDDKKCEYLVLDQLPLTVTDGQINIENCWDDGNLLSAVIVEKVEKDRLWFDFEPTDRNPVAGYIHIDETTTYDPFVGYGIYTRPGHEGEATWSRYRGSGANDLLRDFVAMGNYRDFRVDLPNGDYYVTIVMGDPDYTEYTAINLEENSIIYGLNPDYTVKPAGAPLGILEHTPWQQDLEVIEIPQNSNRYNSGKVRILGYHAQFPDEDDKKTEYLFLDRDLVTVADGQLVISNCWDSGNVINYVEIIPATCSALIEAGYANDGDFNHDCSVDLADFATLSEQWMSCNDPQNSSCVKNW